MSPLAGLALITFAVNLPCGYWRQGLRKLSPAWFVAVHAAVPVIVAARALLDMPWQLAQLPVLVLAYFGGQYLGARLRRARGARV